MPRTGKEYHFIRNSADLLYSITQLFFANCKREKRIVNETTNEGKYCILLKQEKQIEIKNLNQSLLMDLIKISVSALIQDL